MLFLGIEPNFRWKSFVNQFAELARKFSVELVVTLDRPAKVGVHCPTAWAEVQVLTVPVQAVFEPTGWIA